MNPEFEEYLRVLNMPRTLIQRVEDLFPYIQLLSPEETTAIFVSEYVQNDGTRQYESLYFFSKNFVSEAKQFITETDMDVTLLKNQVYYLELKTQDYALREPTEKSRVYLEVYLNPGTQIHFELKASRENCDYAVGILTEILKPNLVNNSA